MTAGEGTVRGYLLTFKDDSWLGPIDGLEEYDPARPREDNMYNREEIDVFGEDGSFLGSHYGYSMSTARVLGYRGILVEGEWQSRGRDDLLN
jgi:gamma-glutamylcyclotransferase (GGCT)/AIG2-like uncharacterized protein YtfP